MEVARLQSLATRAVKKLRGRIPSSTTHEDAINDAIVVILKWEKEPVPEACANQDAFLVMKAWGTLKDNYGREWKRAYKTDPTNFPASKREEDSAGDGNDAAVPLNPVTPRRPVSSGIAEDALPIQQTQMDVREAIGHLDPRGQRIMTAILEGKTHQEIATELGLSQPWVSRLVREAREKLKALLGAYE